MQPKNRRRPLVIISIATGALISLCLCLAIVGALLPDGDTAIATSVGPDSVTLVTVASLVQPTPTSPTKSSRPTDTLTNAPAPKPTADRSGNAVLPPTSAPTNTPLPAPTNTPTGTPTGTPTDMPTHVPTEIPTPTPLPAATSLPAAVPVGAVAAQLVNVVDGDTIDVTIDGQQDTVRYIGMDTPERGQPGYRAATDANRVLMGDGKLFLVTDTSNRDSFGRLLRYVYNADGDMVNAELVAQGWAQPVEYPPDTRHAAEFAAQAQAAADAGLGFWSGAALDGAMPYALTTTGARIRQGPDTGFAINTTVPADTPLTVYGTTPAGDWLQVRAPDRTGGWISTSLVVLNVAANAVPVPDELPQLIRPTATPTTQLPPTPPPVAPPVPPTGPPSVVIGYIFYDGLVSRVESDEYAEIVNNGAGPVDLSGWRLNAGDPGQDFWFPSYTLQPGQSCRVYTNQNHPETCGFSFASGKAIWNNKGDCGGLYDTSGVLASQYCY